MTRLFVKEMRRLGLAPPEPVGMIADEETEFFLPDVAHPSGTTRMSTDPAAGVVDPDCAVHGVEGLHVLEVRFSRQMAMQTRRTRSLPLQCGWRTISRIG